MSVTTAVDQVISCDIGGLGGTDAATVEWLGPNSDVAVVSDTINYVVDQGAASFTNANDGTQKTTLTIKPAKLATLSGTLIYKCSVTSGQYPSSPAANKPVSVTVLSYGKLIGKLLKLVQMIEFSEWLLN